jgi:hypothetical protein
MKKIILSISIAAIAIAGFMYEPASENQTSNDLTVDNAEALATGGAIHPVTCFNDGRCAISGATSSGWATMWIGPDGTIYH